MSEGERATGGLGGRERRPRAADYCNCESIDAVMGGTYGASRKIHGDRHFFAVAMHTVNAVH